MGRLSKPYALVCPVCKSVVELHPDGAYGFDVEHWSSECRHNLGGSPMLCRHFGPNLHSALANPTTGARRDEH